LTGGASSLTFTGLVTGGPVEGERIVLKVAPPGLEPVRNRDVARQARLMRALAGAPGVRVPTVYFEDDGAPPEVPPFHAMNIVPGECLEPLLEEPPPDVMPLVPSRAFAAARMLAALPSGAIPSPSASVTRSRPPSKPRSNGGRARSRPSTRR